MIKVLFVCHGNICRSPMAEMVFKHLVANKGLQDEFFIDSAGTSDEESRYFSPMHKGTKNVLTKNQIPFTEHIARQFTLSDYDKFDYIICMEQYNLTNLLNTIKNDYDKKIYRLLDFSSNPKDVDDPWYHHNFDKTFDEIFYGCKCFLDYIVKNDL